METSRKKEENLTVLEPPRIPQLNRSGSCGARPQPSAGFERLSVSTMTGLSDRTANAVAAATADDCREAGIMVRLSTHPRPNHDLNVKDERTPTFHQVFPSARTSVVEA
jgi:hypothetical protein